MNGGADGEDMCDDYKDEDYCGPDPMKIHF